MGRVWLLLGLAGCFKDDPGPPAPTIGKFAFNASNYQFRDGGCGSGGIFFEGSEGLVVDLAIEGPAQLFDTEGTTQQRGFTMCTALGAHGHGKVHATIEGREDKVDATYDVVVPAEVVGLQPIHVFGPPNGVPTQVRWSDDGAQIYVTSDAQDLRAFDAATLAPSGAWSGLGAHATAIGGQRAVDDLASGMGGINIYDLAGDRSLTTLPGPVGGFVNLPVGQFRGVAGHGDVISVVQYFDHTCAIGIVDLANDTHEVVATLSEDGIMQGGYDPLRAYFQMSPDGNKVAWLGAAGCPTVLDKGGTGEVYDRRTKVTTNCGMEDNDLRPANRNGVNFSYDGSVYAWTQFHDTTVKRLPDCNQIATAHDEFGEHSQLAVSPDGTHIAYVTDLKDGTGRPFTEISHVDLAAQPFVLGGHPQVDVPVTLGLDDQHQFDRHAVSYSPDGKTIAVAQIGGPLRLVDVATGAVRSDQQVALGDPDYVAVSPDFKHAAVGSNNVYAAVDLADGHAIASSAEVIIDVRDDGYVIDPGGTGDLTLVAWGTLARTPLARYAPAPVSAASPNGRRCDILGGAVPQLCVSEASGTHVACVDFTFPNIPRVPLMYDEDRCYFTTNDGLYQFTASTVLLQGLGVDPSASPFHHDSLPLRGPPFSHLMITFGPDIAIWKLPQ